MRDEENESSSAEPSKSAKSTQDIEKLFSKLNLGHANYQRFGHTRASAPTKTSAPRASLALQTNETMNLPSSQQEAPDQKTQERLRIGVYSPMGGAGKSFLAASIGALLCQLGWRVLLIDTSPWHTLAFHFGAQEARQGKRTFLVPGGEGACVHVLSCHSSFTLLDLDSFLVTTPVDCILFDFGGLGEETALSWLKTCERVIIPLLPTMMAPKVACITNERIRALGIAPERFIFVMNLLVPATAAKRVQILLEELLHKQLFPTFIERQKVVDEAFGEGIVLPYFAPNSQAVNVCREIVGWLNLPELPQKNTARRWIEE
jgi:cellulose biosynthesis protein BcsQ